MRKEYNIPQIEVVSPDMFLMDGAESIKSQVGNPKDVNPEYDVNGGSPARKLYI